MKPFQPFYNMVSPLSEKTWADILPLFHQRNLLAGEFFVKEQEIATEIAFLETGVVRAYFTNESGNEYNKQFFVAPSSIGAYTSLLTKKPNRIAQQALTDCVIWSCKFSDLTAFYEKHHDLERLARKIAEHYFLEKEKKELEIVLLEATQRYQLFQQEFPTLEQRISQYHIASYLGITATQLSRIRRKLANKS